MAPITFTLAVLALVFAASPASGQKAADPAELERTWAGGRVYGPGLLADGLWIGDPYTDGALLSETAGRRRPVVIYAHGCGGFGRPSHGDGKLLAEAGYLVFMPSSFARADKPKSCDPVRHLGGLHREVLAWRIEEVRHAVAKSSALPFVDTDNLFLMGFSEGGITAARYPDGPFKARIITGWNCYAGWPEHAGLNAPRDQAVFSAVAGKDPWFPHHWRGESCRDFMGKRIDSHAILVPGFLHHVTQVPEVRSALLEFLARHTGRPR
ncbi:MAG: dienelactone hydrolase family protein [Pseudomonadota bacterium]